MNHIPYAPIDEKLLGEFELEKLQQDMERETKYYNRHLNDELIHARKFRKWAIQEIAELKAFKAWALRNIEVPEWRNFESPARTSRRENKTLSVSPVIGK